MAKPFIRAVFFDVDGTLFRLDTHTMPRSTIDALHALRAKGIKLIAATGRPSQATRFLRDFFDFDAYITSNGQYCYVEDQIIHEGPFQRKTIEQLLALLWVSPFPCLMIEKMHMYINYINEAVKEHCMLTRQPLPPICDVRCALENDIYQFVAYIDTGMEQTLMRTLEAIAPVRVAPMCVDVMPAGGGKSVGMRAIMDYFCIAAEHTMAFGDGMNDMDMLQCAGIGIAMGNAQEALKQCADYVTKDIEHDGIWSAANTFGLI